MAEITYKVHRVFNDAFLDPDSGNYLLTCRVEDVEAGDMFTDDIPFDTFNDAYKFKRMFDYSIDAVEIKVPYEGEKYHA